MQLQLDSASYLRLERVLCNLNARLPCTYYACTYRKACGPAIAGVNDMHLLLRSDLESGASQPARVLSAKICTAARIEMGAPFAPLGEQAARSPFFVARELQPQSCRRRLS